MEFLKSVRKFENEVVELMLLRDPIYLNGKSGVLIPNEMRYPVNVSITKVSKCKVDS